MDVSNAHVLLTGASGGIGKFLAIALARRGAQLTLTGRRSDALAELADRVGGRVIIADLTEPEAPAEVIAQAGRVDILVANAGLPASGPVLEYATDEIDRALEINLRAPILMAKAAATQMIPRGGGHLVFMSSLSGKSVSSNTSLYNATKFGLRGFALALREDLRPHGIGVSSIYPGPVRDAGMIADSRVRLPRAGTVTAAAVGAATIRAIERNRLETTVAPLPLRLATTLGGLAPATSAALARVTHSDRLVAAISDGQRSKR
ncbi:SDR family oxidoreductase [Gordonia oryzae]|uniref:SDR family oxidoreductase n=1 Tax=Gordonia oryzae TaxID=2487349 RepID=A0A3N4GZR6_9ACTN|nr:SDR family oxidoreductase [Gordonia oryzae]RPA66298.1 SDR family oxidoreductase [Gordonia oryzae]